MDDKKCFGVDYPISSEKLASLITKVIGREVGEIGLWDSDKVTRQMEIIYTA